MYISTSTTTEEPPVKTPVHQYSDPYRDGKCLQCGRKRTEKRTNRSNCRAEYHGWQAISENAERAQRRARC